MHAADKDRVFRVNNTNIDDTDKRGPKTILILYQEPVGYTCVQMVKEGDWIILAPDGYYLGWA